jgi:hypothetical protein
MLSRFSDLHLRAAAFRAVGWILLELVVGLECGELVSAVTAHENAGWHGVSE